MSELISGKDVFSALSSGNEVQYNWLRNRSAIWFDLSKELKEFTLQDILSGSTENGDVVFRLKPRTITINGIEVPVPFEPKEGERFYYFSDEYTEGWTSAERTGFYGDMKLGCWHTEEEIKQVVAALREVFK